jgi:hypothetical protein
MTFSCAGVALIADPATFRATRSIASARGDGPISVR